MMITRGDGLVDRDQAAELAGVSPDAVTLWATRGYKTRDGKQRLYLPVAKRAAGPRKPPAQVVGPASNLIPKNARITSGKSE